MASSLAAQDLRRMLESVIAPEDQCVLVYSGIWTFGGPRSAQQVLDAYVAQLTG